NGVSADAPTPMGVVAAAPTGVEDSVRSGRQAEDRLQRAPAARGPPGLTEVGALVDTAAAADQDPPRHTAVDQRRVRRAQGRFQALPGSRAVATAVNAVGGGGEDARGEDRVGRDRVGGDILKAAADLPAAPAVARAQDAA